jgi:hypothetical protein
MGTKKKKPTKKKKKTTKKTKRNKTPEAKRDEIYKITKGAFVQSKANWIEKREKNTPYFLELKRQIQSSNVIHNIKTETDTTVRSTGDILNNLCTYLHLTLSNKERQLYDKFLTIYASLLGI